MTVISMRDLYARVLRRFELSAVGTELLLKICAGSEKADDYEQICKRDRFLTATICTAASAHMKASAVASLSHGVVVVGQERVRNMVLGHVLDRMVSQEADRNYVDMVSSGKSLKYSLRAEEHAKICKNDYPGLALASGFIFDIFDKWIAQDMIRLSALSGFLDGLWRHSLNTATLAWALATHERVEISHRKIIFAAALLHDIGELGLAMYEPDEYFQIIEKMKSQAGSNLTDDAFEAAVEREFFDLSHAEIGSAIVFETKFLRDVEVELDFHHDTTLLRTRNSDAFLGAAVVNIADRVAWLLEHQPGFGLTELQEILKPHAAYFPLKAPDLLSLYADCRARNLLNK